MSQAASGLFHHRMCYAFTPRIGLRCFFCTVPCKSFVFSYLFADLIKHAYGRVVAVFRTGESEQS